MERLTKQSQFLATCAWTNYIFPVREILPQSSSCGYMEHPAQPRGATGIGQQFQETAGSTSAKSGNLKLCAMSPTSTSTTVQLSTMSSIVSMHIKQKIKSYSM